MAPPGADTAGTTALPPTPGAGGRAPTLAPEVELAMAVAGAMLLSCTVGKMGSAALPLDKKLTLPPKLGQSQQSADRGVNVEAFEPCPDMPVGLEPQLQVELAED